MKRIIVECEEHEADDIYEQIKQVTMRRNPLDEPFVYIEKDENKEKIRRK
jgi:hypothetical protein